MHGFERKITALVFTAALIGLSGAAGADSGHPTEGADPAGTMEEMREQHREHEHGHDFEAMEELDPEQMARVMTLMRDVGLAMPPMDAARGRELFVNTGCVVCHSVNGVGGDIGPALDAGMMPSPMNSFEFAARMWRGAGPMTMMQEAVLGETIPLTGQDLADIIAFAHDEEEQGKLTDDQIPAELRELMAE